MTRTQQPLPFPTPTRPRRLPVAAGANGRRNFLSVYRKQHHLTQAQLAKLLRVNVRTVKRWEQGDLPEYREHQLAGVLGLDGVDRNIAFGLPGWSPDTLDDERKEALGGALWPGNAPHRR